MKNALTGILLVGIVTALAIGSVSAYVVEDGTVYIDHRKELPKAMDYLGPMTKAQTDSTLSDMCLNVETTAPIVRGPYFRTFYKDSIRQCSRIPGTYQWTCTSTPLEEPYYKSYCYYRGSSSYRTLWTYQYVVGEDGKTSTINPSLSGTYFDGYHSKFPLPENINPFE